MSMDQTLPLLQLNKMSKIFTKNNFKEIFLLEYNNNNQSEAQKLYLEILSQKILKSNNIFDFNFEEGKIYLFSRINTKKINNTNI